MKKKKYIFMIIFIFIFSIIVIVGKSYAKYASNIIWNYKLESKGFYFSSPDLNLNKIENVNNNWSGENITFSIKNGNNDLVVSNYDINYTVTCTVVDNPNITCNMYDTNTNTYNGILSYEQSCINNTEDMVDVRGYSKTECEINGYEWKNSLTTKQLYFNLNSEYEIENVEVDITVSSTSPYKKTLQGRYLIHKNPSSLDNLTFNYIDKDSEGLMVITNTYNGIKCGNISFDSSNLRLINDLNINSYKTDENGYINQFDFSINGKDSISFDFFEKKSDIYDNTNFTLTETSCN